MGFVAVVLLLWPGSMAPRFRVAVPESPQTVMVHAVIGLFPLFFIVAETSVVVEVLTMSIDTTCMLSCPAITPAVLKKRLYITRPPATVMLIKIIVARSGLTALLHHSIPALFLFKFDCRLRNGDYARLFKAQKAFSPFSRSTVVSRKF